MKKVFAYLAALALCFSVCTTAAVKAEDSANVYVTISDSTGAFQVTAESVAVSDIDGDGALTINDALYCAHESFYEGGAEAGYGSYTGDYGLSLGKLWGDESGSFGYYVNNASAWSLADPVAEGDKVNAFIYQDQTAWSDMYTFFDVSEADSDADGNVTLTLTGCGFDENWNPISVPVESAQIIINGEATDIFTDENGTAVIPLFTNGINVISARTAATPIVPPVCLVNAQIAEISDNSDTDVPETAEPVAEELPETLPQTGLVSSFLFVALGTALVGSGAGVVAKNKKN